MTCILSGGEHLGKHPYVSGVTLCAPMSLSLSGVFTGINVEDPHGAVQPARGGDIRPPLTATLDALCMLGLAVKFQLAADRTMNRQARHQVEAAGKIQGLIRSVGFETHARQNENLRICETHTGKVL